LTVARHRRLAWIVLLGYWVFIAAVTHLPPTKLPETGIKDTYEHFTAFALLAVLLCTALSSLNWSIARVAGWSFAIAAAYGAIDEGTQPLVGRVCSLSDWMADASGAAVAVALFVLVRSVGRALSGAGRAGSLPPPP
jgi:VanZ family protein